MARERVIAQPVGKVTQEIVLPNQHVYFPFRGMQHEHWQRAAEHAVRGTGTDAIVENKIHFGESAISIGVEIRQLTREDAKDIQFAIRQREEARRLYHFVHHIKPNYAQGNYWRLQSPAALLKFRVRQDELESELVYVDEQEAKDVLAKRIQLSIGTHQYVLRMKKRFVQGNSGSFQVQPSRFRENGLPEDGSNLFVFDPTLWPDMANASLVCTSQ